MPLDDTAYRFLFYIEQNYAFAILRPLQAYALAQGHEVQWLLVGGDVPVAHLTTDEKKLNNIEAAIAYQPHAVFVPGDRVPAFIPGLKVQVFHGLNENKRGNEYPERGLFDLYCTEGPERTSSLSALATQRGYFNVVETGWLKLDSLFAGVCTQNYERPQILFSSTFSPSLSCAEFIYDEIKSLSQSLPGTQAWQWLVTLHPKMDQDLVERYRELENENLTFFENDKVIELLHRADVMVCDNSSIFQEFLLLKKPVVTVNNRDPQPAFINITEASQLQPAIHQALTPNVERQKYIDAYGPAITPYLDGQSAARVLAAVKDRLVSGWQDSKPRNRFRELKMRKKLGYWRW